MAREQRRLAAIVAADVVGYSRLMGRDESGTLSRLRDHRKQRFEPALARHGGRLVKLSGDGALVEFASAVEAVAAAIEFQQAMAEINRGEAPEGAFVFRIGVHLGDLIVDGDDLYGDGVNIAARLEAQAPAGGILISRTVHEAVVRRLNATFADLGSLALKNIEQPVQAFQVKWEPSDWLAPPPGASATDDRPPSPEIPLALPEKPSIAVLPFTNMSGDPEQEYFADGIAEDIITELSRFRDLFVIARNSSFTYKAKAIDVRQVARELGVRYVLEGSVRRASNRVRITGQLIDAETGAHLWAQRYDRDLSDIFVLQEEITRAIVASIAPAIDDLWLARVRRASPGNLGAYELAMRAWSEGYAAFQAGDAMLRDRAAIAARRALDIDPECVRAWLALSHINWQSEFYSGRDSTMETCRMGLEAARRAIELDRSEHRAYTIRGLLNLLLCQYDDALADLRRAFDMNPNDAMAVNGLAFGEVIDGDGEAAKDHLLYALRLSPRDPLRFNACTLLGNACFLTRDYAEGVTWIAECKRDHPNFPPAIAVSIKLLVGLGEIDRARAEAKLFQRLSPMSAERLRAGGSILRRTEHREREFRYYQVAFSPTSKAAPIDNSALEAPVGAPTLPDKPSIAVLPFTNMSGDAEQDYFVDGISEDIITELTRFRTLFVIARNSSFSYKGKSPDVRDVGRELGVRYVLEGSVRKASNRIRLTGQLVDTHTGNHIWAERYDRQLDDVFVVQEELTRSIVRAIAPQISEAELAKVRRRRFDSLTAYEIGVRAQAMARDAFGRSDTELCNEALRVAHSALAIDPGNTIALAARIEALSQHLWRETAADYKTAWVEANAAVDRMLELEPSSSYAHLARAHLFLLAPDGPRWDDALAIARQGHELNPHDLQTLTMLAFVENMGGYPERAIELGLEALRLSPRDPRRPHMRQQLAMACFGARRYADAIEHAKRGIAEAPTLPPLHTTLAESYVAVGQFDLARSAFADARRTGPQFVDRLLSGKTHHRNPDHVARVTTFLRIAAGLEDPSAADALR